MISIKGFEGETPDEVEINGTLYRRADLCTDVKPQSYCTYISPEEEAEVEAIIRKRQNMDIDMSPTWRKHVGDM